MNDKKSKAISIIKSNSRGNFTIPCDTLYPFQWNWDSAFSALGIYSYDEERALSEIDMLFKGQWDNGMIPHIIFHKEAKTYFPGPEIWESNTTPKTSCISQPPVITSVIWFMITMGFNNKEKINYYFDKLMKYHIWYITNRDPYNKGLLSIFHPWESGRDNSPEWDDALSNITFDDTIEIKRKDNNIIEDNLRPTDEDYNKYIQILYKCKELDWDGKEIYDNGLFNVCDPGVQFIFIKSCKDLYKIAHYLNKTQYFKHIEKWIDLYSTNSDFLWNCKTNSYSTLNIHTNRLYNGISCGSMLYAYADIGSVEQKKYMIQHSKKILFFSAYGFPSWDPMDRKFDSKKYWRGPVWCIINFILALGFIQTGETDLAIKIKNSTINLIEKYGFFEYYDPQIGKGYGGDNFSWTAAIYLIFKQDYFI